MAFKLLDSVKGLLGNDHVSKASIILNEDEDKVKSAMSGIIPSVLAGILNKAGSGDVGGVFNLAKDTANSGMLSSLRNFLGNNSSLIRGSDLVKNLFGDHTNDVANTLSNFYGIRSSSVASLMSVVAPAALGSIGKHAEATKMSASGFLSFLYIQKDSILAALPQGLNLAGALGLSSLGSIGSKLSGKSNVTPPLRGLLRDMEGKEIKTGSSRWFIPALLAIVALGLLWYFLTGKNNPVETAQSTTTSATSQPGIASAPPVSESTKVKLPNGIEINAHKGGIEDQLVEFLTDPSRKVDKDIWFDFDNLNFETGSATITPESMIQVLNVAAILKAFPSVRIKIGGYTDKTGDVQGNMKLSQDRAKAVVNALNAQGITKYQVSGAEGYGSQFAKAPAEASDNERKKDRRIAVSVRKK